MDLDEEKPTFPKTRKKRSKREKQLEYSRHQQELKSEDFRKYPRVSKHRIQFIPTDKELEHITRKRVEDGKWVMPRAHIPKPKNKFRLYPLCESIVHTEPDYDENLGKKLIFTKFETLPKYSVNVDCSMIPIRVQMRDAFEFWYKDDKPAFEKDGVLFREMNMPFLRPVLIDGVGVSRVYNDKLAESKRTSHHLNAMDAKFTLQMQAMIRCLYYWISEGHKAILLLPDLKIPPNFDVTKTHSISYDGHTISDPSLYLLLRDINTGLVKFSNEERFSWVLRESLAMQAMVVTDKVEWDNHRTKDPYDVALGTIDLLSRQVAIPGWVQPNAKRPLCIFHPFFFQPGDQVIFPPDTKNVNLDISQYDQLKIKYIGNNWQQSFNFFVKDQLLVLDQLKQMRFLLDQMPKDDHAYKEKTALQGLVAKILPLLLREMKKQHKAENDRRVVEILLSQ